MSKAFVYVDSGDTAAHDAATAGVSSVLAEYGMRILVDANDAQLQALENEGLAVQPADTLDVITLPSVVIDTSEGDPPAPPPGWETNAAPNAAVYWIVQFVGPPLPDWVEAVQSAGAQIVSTLGDTAVLAKMTSGVANTVRGLSDVQWVGRHEPLYTIEPTLANEPAPVPVGEQERLTKAAGGNGIPANEHVEITVALFDASKRSDVVAAIEGAGGTVEASSGDTIVCGIERSGIPAIAALPAVGHISRYFPATLGLQFARPITAVDTVFNHHGLDGEGEVVGVADTGLDRGVDDATLHNDFRTLAGGNGRITGYGLAAALPAPLTRAGFSDPNGHGTHVAGITAGNGASSGAGRPMRGVAFNAHIVMQALLDGTGGIRGIPDNLNALFRPVYDNDGVRAHNNSWGLGATFASYTGNQRARQIDEFVWRNPDFAVIFIAHNFGTDGPLNSAALVPGMDGISDFSTITPEATSRNGITVGGCENNRPAVALQWGVLWATGARFFAPPLATDPVANNAGQLLAFSGRGPTTAASGSRIKPDVVAPGSSIFSAYSPISPTSNFWGVRPAGSPYIFQGGTSMAAPHVTGMAALIRQYLRRVHGISDPENPQRRRRRPSAALVKALLVHGGQTLTAGYPASAVDNHGPVPSNHQGWGLVNMQRSLFSNPIGAVAAADATWLPRRTIFIDDPDRHLNGLPAANPNSRRRHSVRVRVLDASVPLRATLVWTDFPGPVGHPGTLVNGLRLSIDRHNADATVTNFPVVAPAGLAPAGLNLLNNNVQQIDIAAPNLVAGREYVIHVDALAIGSFPTHGEEQDFALVISGPLSHSDHALPGTLVALPDLAFVDLEPNGPQQLHDGLAPAREPPTGNPGSPDVWVSRDAVSDPARAVGHVEVGQQHNVWVRVRNLGFAPAPGARIRVFWGDPTGPLDDMASWKTSGFKIGAVTGNEMTATVPGRGETIVGPFSWDPPENFERVALLVRAEHANDPVRHEGDVRFDNNLTRRDVVLQDNRTTVHAEPSGFDRFIFWLISGFSSPRDIEMRLLLSYLDVRDGTIKPLPPGVQLEIYDYDPVSGDDRLGTARTATTTGPDGRPATAVHATFTTFESGEGSPDLYVKVLRPTGPQFADFLAGSFFAAGADSWSSRSQTTADGGFFLEDLDGNRVGIPTPVQLVMKPQGIRVNAIFESLDQSGFHPLPAGIPVKIIDSRPGVAHPLLATVRTNAHGAISTVVRRSGDERPSLYFLIEKTDDAAFLQINYFLTQQTWDSRPLQAEVIDRDGNVTSTVPGHFQELDHDELVAAPARLRFRLESPGVHVHLRFEYFDREAGAYRPVPPRTIVEAWEDVAGATQPLVRGEVGANGAVDLAVPNNNRPQISLFVRLVMKRTLTSDADSAAPATVEIRKAGATLRYDTKGNTATDGTAGAFHNVARRVPAAGGPLVFRIGTGAGDPNDEASAPFALRVIGEAHDWLRSRADSGWNGVFGMGVDIVSRPTEGSSFDGPLTAIKVNTVHTIAGQPQPDHWNRRAIVHQYGHLVLETLYGSPLRLSPGVPNHRNFNAATERDRRIAFAEGFCDYLATRHLAAPVSPDPSTPPRMWRGADGDGANNSGEIVPAAIANALWHVDQNVVGSGHQAITDPVNKRRFQALIWNPLTSLNDADGTKQIAYQLYRAIQTANLAAGDLIAAHSISFVRQLVRTTFEANGLVFGRGQITANPAVVGGRLRFQLAPADRARLNVAELGAITAYRIQGRRVGGTGVFAETDQLVSVTHANQRETLDLNTVQARETGALDTAGTYDWRVVARDEFGAWDSFADDFTGNGGATATSNDQWQRDRLHSMRGQSVLP